MPNKSSTQIQRDQFLAFAFASADLFIEISQEHKITYAIGAARGITGIDHGDLLNKNWLEIFAPLEQAALIEVYETAKAGLRCRPKVINLADKYGGDKAIVTGIRMPDDPNFYLTLGFSNTLMEEISEAEESVATLTPKTMQRNTFINFAQSIIRVKTEVLEQSFITLIDLQSVLGDKESFGEKILKKIISSVENRLLATSIDGLMCGTFAPGHYSVLHTKSITQNDIKKEVQKAIEQSIPDYEINNITIKTIENNLKTVDKNEVIWAITKVLNEFENFKHGENNDDVFPLKTLQDALNTHKDTKEYRVKELNNAIQRVSFGFAFQPIIDLKTMKEDHFEMFCRFEDGGHPHEWITLAEEEGIIGAVDLAVSERVINHVNFKEGGTTRKFSMNFCASSIHDENFYENFIERFKKYPALSKRLIFEIRGLEKQGDEEIIAQFFTELKSAGFRISWDEASVSDRTLKSIDAFNFDFIKISGNDLLKAAKDKQHFATIAQFVRDMKTRDIIVVAKHIENKAQLKIAQKLEVDFGQGFYFAKPKPKPIYPYPKD